jgi:iron-sulfur cluster repair protein YtfE (RIC family)
MLQAIDRTAEPGRPSEDDEGDAFVARAVPAADVRRPDGSRPVPDAALVSHIVQNHHAPARRALPYIVPLLAKVAGRHGRRDGRLNVLCDAGQQLSDALEAYMDEEESVLFPALVAGARDAARRELPHLFSRQRELELLLGRVRALADGFVAPDWGDGPYRALMEELEALDEEVSEELHLESYALLPRMLPRWADAE